MTKKPAVAPKLEDPRITSLEAHVAQSRNTVVKLAREIHRRDILLARREGYIERVQEMDSAHHAAPAKETDGLSRYIAPRIADGVRDCLANGSETEAARLLDQIDPDLMDRILGKPDVPLES